MMAFSRTSCLSLSPACIRRATVTLPSVVILTQQSSVVSMSRATVLSILGGRAAPVVATGAGDGVAADGTAAWFASGAAAGGADAGVVDTAAGVRTRIVK